MRTGTTKGNNARKVLSFYRVNFGYEPPYRVLLDPDMIQTSIANNLFIKHTLPNLLNASATVVVTACVVRTLREAGESHSSASLFAKRATRIPCTHEGKRSAVDCIKSRLITPYDFKLLLASNDTALIAALASTPGIPLISLVNNTKLVLRPPTKLTLQYVRHTQSVEERTLSSSDKSLVERVRAQENAAEHQNRIVRKRKRAKAPNPLSVKKSSKKPVRPAADLSSSPTDPLSARRNSPLMDLSASYVNNETEEKQKNHQTKIAENTDSSVLSGASTPKLGRKRKRLRTRQKSSTTEGEGDFKNTQESPTALEEPLGERTDKSPSRKRQKTPGKPIAGRRVVREERGLEKQVANPSLNRDVEDGYQKPPSGAECEQVLQEKSRNSEIKGNASRPGATQHNITNETVVTNVPKPEATKSGADATQTDNNSSEDKSAAANQPVSKDANLVLSKTPASPKAIRDLKADGTVANADKNANCDVNYGRSNGLPLNGSPNTESTPVGVSACEVITEKGAAAATKQDFDSEAHRKKQRKNRRRRPKKGDADS